MQLSLASYFLLITFTVALFDLHDIAKGDDEMVEHQEPNCQDKCGRPMVKPNCGNRIVGGTRARKYSWCWQASLQRKGNNGFFHTCGGSCINSRWIVTAAHCVYGNGGPDNFQISLGDFDRSESKATSQRVLFPVERIVIHADYIGQKDYWQHDIALVKVTTNIKFNKYVCPVCLPQSDYTDDLDNCWAIGWGRDSTDGSASMFLQQVTMKHYSNAECSQPSWYGSMIRDSMISFGHCVGGMGTCQGDSGGPLVCTDKDGTQWFLYGLTSWAKGGCASPNHPTIFTDVAKYVDWIHVNMVDMYNDEDYTWC